MLTIAHVITAPVQETENIVLSSPFQVTLNCNALQTLGRHHMSSVETCLSMSEYMATIGFHYTGIGWDSSSRQHGLGKVTKASIGVGVRRKWLKIQFAVNYSFKGHWNSMVLEVSCTSTPLEAIKIVFQQNKILHNWPKIKKNWLKVNYHWT